jgi:hypothetical protein
MRENAALTILFTGIPPVNRHGFVHTPKARLYWFVTLFTGVRGYIPLPQYGGGVRSAEWGMEFQVFSFKIGGSAGGGIRRGCGG